MSSLAEEHNKKTLSTNSSLLPTPLNMASRSHHPGIKVNLQRINSTDESNGRIQLSGWINSQKVI